MGDYQPHFFPADQIPLVLTGTVSGGQMVTAAGIAAGVDAGSFVGVADRDGVSGDQITPYTTGVHTLIAGGTIAVGDRVKCGAAGTVVKFTGGTDNSDLQVGKALTASTSTNPVDILFP